MFTSLNHFNLKYFPLKFHERKLTGCHHSIDSKRDLRLYKKDIGSRLSAYPGKMDPLGETDLMGKDGMVLLSSSVIEMKGSPAFRTKVLGALKVLEESSPEDYAFVEKYIGKIEAGAKTVAHVNESIPKLMLSEFSAQRYSEHLIAGIIINAAHRASLLKAYQGELDDVPREIWCGERANEDCLDHQIRVMQKIGAHSHEIGYVSASRRLVVLDGMEIIGDAFFREKVFSALHVLKGNFPDLYKDITRLIPRIEKIGSGEYAALARANEKEPRMELSAGMCSQSSPNFIASVIFHEYWHFKLYHDYKKVHGSVPNEIWAGEKAEWSILEKQIEMLKELGGSFEELQSLENWRGKKWWR